MRILPALITVLVALCGAACPAALAALSEAGQSQAAQTALTDKAFDDLAKQIDEGALMTARSKVESYLTRFPQDWRVALLAARLYRKMGLSGLAMMQYEK